MEALARCSPSIRIHDPVLFGDVVEQLYELATNSVRFTELVATLAGDLEEWQAEKLRTATLGVATLGILVPVNEGAIDQLEDRRYRLAPAASSLDRAFDLVEVGIRDRLGTYSWPIPEHFFDVMRTGEPLDSDLSATVS